MRCVRGAPGDDWPDSRTNIKWLVSSVFATALMADQAYAKEATDNITIVLSPNSFTQ
jgi:hypothetical protein